MLTRMWQLALFSIFLSLSIPANSKSITKSDIISAALPFIKQGLNEAPLKCLGISKAELDLTFEQANLTCQSNVPKLMQHHEFEQYVSTFSNCVTAGVQQSFDVSDEQVQRCESNAEISYTNSINGDFDDPQAYLERIANKVNKALIQHAQLSNTENIPLPLYPNHKVISHFPDGMDALSEKESLPVLVIASNDSYEDVIDFYQNSLSNFKRYNVVDGVIFMKKEVPDFDLLRHFSTYISTPHVMIEDMKKRSIDNKVGSTKIEISYRKQRSKTELKKGN